MPFSATCAIWSRDRLRHGRVLLDARDEAARERGDQDRADQRGAERGAEVLRGALEAARLVGLGRIDRRHDHVAELREQQPGAHAEDRERDRELRLVRARRRSCRAAARDASDERDEPGLRDPLRSEAGGEPRSEHAPRGTSSPTSGTAACRSRRRRGRARPGGRPAGRRTCPSRISCCIISVVSPARSGAILQQRAVEQRVPALALAALLPHREGGEEADAGEDQERHDREAERRDLRRRRSVSAPRGSIRPHSLLLRMPKTTRPSPAADSSTPTTSSFGGCADRRRCAAAARAAAGCR